MFRWCGLAALGASGQVGELQRAFESLCFCCYSVAKSHLTLRPHELRHARLPCPSLSPGVCSNLYPLRQSSPVQPSLPQDSPGYFPSPWQTLIYFRSLWICLCKTFHINGIIHLSVWLLLCGITFLPCHSACFFIPFYGGMIFHGMDRLRLVYLCLGWWVWGLFLPLAVTNMLLWTLVCQFLCGCMCSSLLVVYQGVELLEHVLILYLTIWRAARLLCKAAALLCDPMSSVVRETQVRSLVGKILWRTKWQSTTVLLSGKFHGWRSLVGYGVAKSRTQLSDFTFFFSVAWG